MQKKLLKGNYAIVEAAIAAGCRFFYGYPITPQSEIMEHMSEIMEAAGGTFLQAESEVGAMNMVIGAAVSGGVAMTASSGPGIDLMQEGLGNLHAHQAPVVVADIMRAGPGDGALHPSQGDYSQAVRGGRSDTRNIVFAPWNVQEMYDLTIEAFLAANKYKNPAFILAESYLGQVYESLEMREPRQKLAVREDAVTGAENRERRISIAHFPHLPTYHEFHRKLQEKYRLITEQEQRSESYFTEDAELIAVAYGMTARCVYAAVKELREQGAKVGLFRPKTLWPFPQKALREALGKDKKLMVIELTGGQMAEDIILLTQRHDLILKPGIVVGDIPVQSEMEAWMKEALAKQRG